MRSSCQKDRNGSGGGVIHMVNGNSKGFKVLGKNEEYGVSDA